MFLWMLSPLISGGPLLSLRCSARVRHCLRLLVGVVDMCTSRLVRLICCWIILIASSPMSLFICRSLAIRLLVLSHFFRRLLLDLDPYDDTDPLDMFHLFPKRTANVMAPRLRVVFWRLVRLGSFPACWRQAKITTIPKGPRTVRVCCQLPTDFYNISIVYGVWASGVGSSRTIYGTQWCASYHPGCLSERSGSCDALLCVSHTLQSALDRTQEHKIVQIDFSAALDSVNHQGMLYKLCSVGIGGSMFSILTLLRLIHLYFCILCVRSSVGSSFWIKLITTRYGALLSE